MLVATKIAAIRDRESTELQDQLENAVRFAFSGARPMCFPLMGEAESNLYAERGIPR